MSCIKCGRVTEGTAVFCRECLEGMEKYPVKPGTVVILPNTPRPAAPKKAPVRRFPTPEEQLRRSKRINWILAVLLAVAVLTGAVLGAITRIHFREKHKQYLPGQNYSAVGSHTTPTSYADAANNDAADMIEESTQGMDAD